ncbi:MAG: hypothetical protein JRI97_13140, partial [Deltaproteobacteria bacterium]|nr:hypothetical protein [Deltaproteobacteria bacterium]
MLYTAVSALCVMLAFPRAGLWPLALVGLVPLFLSLKDAAGLGRAFLRGFVFGLLLVAGMGWWLFPAIVGQYEKPWWAAAVFVPLLVGLPFGLVYGLFGAAFRALYRPGLFFAALAAPSLWVLAEYAKEAWGLLVPWAVLGYAAAPFAPLLSTAGWWGLYGITFVLAAVNGLLFHACLQARGGDKAARRAALSTALAFLAVALPAAGGALWRPPEAQKDLPVAVVQGNFSQKERWSGMGVTNRVR